VNNLSESLYAAVPCPGVEPAISIRLQVRRSTRYTHHAAPLKGSLGVKGGARLTSGDGRDADGYRVFHRLQ